MAGGTAGGCRPGAVERSSESACRAGGNPLWGVMAVRGPDAMEFNDKGTCFPNPPPFSITPLSLHPSHTLKWPCAVRLLVLLNMGRPCPVLPLLPRDTCRGRWRGRTVHDLPVS